MRIFLLFLLLVLIGASLGEVIKLFLVSLLFPCDVTSVVTFLYLRWGVGEGWYYFEGIFRVIFYKKVKISRSPGERMCVTVGHNIRDIFLKGLD